MGLDQCAAALAGGRCASESGHDGPHVVALELNPQVGPLVERAIRHLEAQTERVVAEANRLRWARVRADCAAVLFVFAVIIYGWLW